MYVCDDARAARFSFSFGGDGQANLVAVVAEIGTGANWRKYAQDDKVTAGVMIELSTSSP